MVVIKGYFFFAFSQGNTGYAILNKKRKAETFRLSKLTKKWRKSDDKIFSMLEK